MKNVRPLKGGEKHTRATIDARAERMPSGCWEWRGFIGPLGYGAVNFDGRRWAVHRLFYTWHKGEIPAGLKVLHSCDNRKCCNPAHLSVGTQQDNLEDMRQKGRHWRDGTTHCRRGHEYTPENTAYRPSAPTIRQCKICSRGRLRMKAGWPEHLAFSERTVPLGYAIDRNTGEIISASEIRNTEATKPRPLTARVNHPDRYPRNKALRAKRRGAVSAGCGQ